MAVLNLPGENQGDLARAVTHESDASWPFTIEIVAYFGDGKKGKRKSVTITRDMYFGRNGHGSPLSGDAIIQMIEKLRRT